MEQRRESSRQDPHPVRSHILSDLQTSYRYCSQIPSSIQIYIYYMVYEGLGSSGEERTSLALVHLQEHFLVLELEDHGLLHGLALHTLLGEGTKTCCLLWSFMSSER